LEDWLNLLAETHNHFAEGALSVRAYTAEKTYVITRVANSNHFYVTLEEVPFEKVKVDSLDKYFKDVFGIEARY
jgi:hypothetical protein